MDDIAERAGVSKPVLYQHFPGKLELYRALLTTYADELVGRVERAITSTNDNQLRVEAAVAATSTSSPERGRPSGSSSSPISAASRRPRPSWTGR